MRCFLPSLAASLVWLLQSANAFPFGAGGCAGGAAAVGGFHLDFGDGSASGRQGSTGTLLDGGTALIINDIIMEQGVTVTFPTGIDLVWSVQAFTIDYRGLLVRLEAPADVDLSGAITGAGTELQVADICTGQTGNVVGITHTSNSDKGTTGGIVRFDVPTTGVTFDVTAVYRNGNVAPDNFSIYAYSGFTANFEGAAPVAPAPVLVPVPVTTPPFPERPPVPVPGQCPKEDDFKKIFLTVPA